MKSPNLFNTNDSELWESDDDSQSSQSTSVGKKSKIRLEALIAQIAVPYLHEHKQQLDFEEKMLRVVCYDIEKNLRSKKYKLGKVDKNGVDIAEALPKCGILGQKWIPVVTEILEKLCTVQHIALWKKRIYRLQTISTTPTAGITLSEIDNQDGSNLPNIPTKESSQTESSNPTLTKTSKKRKLFDNIVEEKITFEEQIQQLQELINAPEKDNIKILAIHQDVLLRVVKKKEKIKTAMQILRNTAETGRVDKIQEIISQNEGAVNRTNGLATPLHYAARNGQLAACQLLIDNGANINAKTNTPLHNAVENDHDKVCELLMEHGADISLKNIHSKTPLMLAKRISTQAILSRNYPPKAKASSSAAKPSRFASLSSTDPSDYNVPSVQRPPPPSAFAPVVQEPKPSTVQSSRNNTSSNDRVPSSSAVSSSPSQPSRIALLIADNRSASVPSAPKLPSASVSAVIESKSTNAQGPSDNFAAFRNVKADADKQQLQLQIEKLLEELKNKEKEVAELKSKIEEDTVAFKSVEQKLEKEYQELDKENQELIEQLEKCSMNICNIVEERDELAETVTALEQVVLQAQNNRNVSDQFSWSALKLPQAVKYEELLKQLLHYQNSLLCEKDVQKKQELITKRNAKRREIVACVEQMIEHTHSYLKQFIKEAADKKLEQFIFIKMELEKDIAIEQQLQQTGGESFSDLQNQLEELEEELDLFERKLKRNPHDAKIAEHLQQTKIQFYQLQSKMAQQNEYAKTTLKRSNPLFGFPELQAAMLDSLQQEKLEDLKKVYIIEQNNINFFVGTRKDNQSKVFVKKFGKMNDWKHFKTEVETLKKLNHQCVITINRAMYDNDFYYIEMPFIAYGTLNDWLCKSTNQTDASQNVRTPFEVQRMMRLVIQTIDYLHENGILHRDLKMENIMMQSEAIPVIIDFELSKNDQQVMSVSTMKGGTHGYMDPAVLWGIAPTNSKSDIYSFGVTLLKCFSKFPLKASVVPMPNKDVPDLKTSDLIVEDSDLIQLLKKCLHKDQEKRPTAREVIYSSFFLKHLSNAKEEQQKEEINSRVMAFKKFVQEKRTALITQPAVSIQLQEDKAIECLTPALLTAANSATIYHSMKVRFEGQNGLDAGALTTSLFRKYFEQAVEKKMLEKGSSCFHICTDAALLSWDKSLEKRKSLMIGFGIILAKCLYEGRSIGSIQLSNALLKFLLVKEINSISIGLIDLEQFDISMSNELSNMHLMEDVSQLYLDFSDLKLNGELTELTNQNLEEYILLKCYYVLIESRRQNLEWIREGFYKMKELKEHLQMLHVNDYHVLLTGEQMIDIPSIVNHCLEFLPLESSYSTNQAHYLKLQSWIKEVLLEFSQEEFKQLLLFCTGYCSTQSKDKLFENGNIQTGYARDKINVKIVGQWKASRLPEAHVCFFRLELPLYENKSQLEQKLKQAISSVNDFYANQ